MALKVIKPGMDTAQVVARFEAERQALVGGLRPSSTCSPIRAPRYPSPAYYNFILDWFDELQRLVPSD